MVYIVNVKITIMNLKTFLKKNGMSYSELAENLGLASKSAVGQWFSRGSVPRHWWLQLERVMSEITIKRNKG